MQEVTRKKINPPCSFMAPCCASTLRIHLVAPREVHWIAQRLKGGGKMKETWNSRWRIIILLQKCIIKSVWGQWYWLECHKSGATVYIGFITGYCWEVLEIATTIMSAWQRGNQWWEPAMIRPKLQINKHLVSALLSKSPWGTLKWIKWDSCLKKLKITCTCFISFLLWG